MKLQAPTSTLARVKTRMPQARPRKMQFIARAVLIAFLFVLSMPAFAQQQKIDSLLKVLENTKADTSRVKLLYNISSGYLYMEPHEAIEFAKQGLALSNKIGYKEGQSICLNALGRSYSIIGKYDSAMVCFENRYEIAKLLKDSIGIASAFNNMGIIYYNFGDYKKAIDFARRANKIYASNNEKNLLAKGYNNIGNIYKDQAEYITALEYYLKAYTIFEEEKNELDIYNPLLNISGIYSYLKQYGKAKQYALMTKEKSVNTNNLIGIGASLYSLSYAYGGEGDFRNAIKYLNEAKIIFDKARAVNYQALANQAFGKIYYEHGEKEKALNYFQTALPIAQKIGDSRLISTLYVNLGDAYSDKRDSQEALAYFQAANKIFIELKDKRSLLEISADFIVLYARMNQPDSVKKYLDKYKQLQDTIYSEQTSKSIAEMQTKYETEKKDKEILALNLDAEKKKNTVWAVSSGAVLLLVVSGSGFVVYSNRKRREQAVLLQTISETDMKALRSQMNPHFIFNCIHTINRLLNGLKIEESKACLDQFSNLTRSVLENSKKREIPLSDELETLRLYMDLENMRFARPFQYSIVIAPGIDQETTLVPPLILQPFVENAIKHGFRVPEKPGLLKIAIRTENQSLICTVEDNGVGRNTVNTKIGSGFKKESLGIKLTEERLNLISKTKKTKSYLLIDDLVDANNKPTGTRVKMYMPYELSV